MQVVQTAAELQFTQFYISKEHNLQRLVSGSTVNDEAQEMQAVGELHLRQLVIKVGQEIHTPKLTANVLSTQLRQTVEELQVAQLLNRLLQATQLFR